MAWWAATSIVLGILVGGFLAISLPLGVLWLPAVPLGLGVLVVFARSRLLALAVAFLTLGGVWLLWVRPAFVAACEYDDCDYSTLLTLGLLSLAVGAVFGAFSLWETRRASPEH